MCLSAELSRALSEPIQLEGSIIDLKEWRIDFFHLSLRLDCLDSDFVDTDETDAIDKHLLGDLTALEIGTIIEKEDSLESDFTDATANTADDIDKNEPVNSMGDEIEAIFEIKVTFRNVSQKFGQPMTGVQIDGRLIEIMKAL